MFHSQYLEGTPPRPLEEGLTTTMLSEHVSEHVDDFVNNECAEHFNRTESYRIFKNKMIYLYIYIFIYIANIHILAFDSVQVYIR